MTEKSVVIVAAHDTLGGAARAIYRVFDSLSNSKGAGFKIRLRVISKNRDSSGVLGGRPVRSPTQNASYFFRTRIRKLLKCRPFVPDSSLLHSPATYPTGLAREINALNPDLVMFGWLGNATISIEEIARVNAPVIFRMSDMWVFSGAEHYTDSRRYLQGYSRSSRPSAESGPDLNRKTFLRKRRSWTGKPNLVALSKWLSHEADLSELTSKWPKHVIPVPMDVDFWRPLPQDTVRASLGISKNELLIVFGAGAGMAQPHKGASILVEALSSVSTLAKDRVKGRRVKMMVFGQDEGPKLLGNVPAEYLGRLDDEDLRRVYSAADVVVMPSFLEAFGQVAAEAQCCGAPVVALRNTGVEDIVLDKITGRLVDDFNPLLLAEAIVWVLEDANRRATLRKNARKQAILRFSSAKVAEEYAALFRSVLGVSAKPQPDNSPPENDYSSL